MSGTITISLQQQFHVSTGLPLSGGRLDFFQAGTISTRQNAFKDSTLSLTNVHPNPLFLESDGRVPFLWFADGAIKVRLSDSTGVGQFEYDNIPVIGGSSGGAGVDTTDVNSIFTTGMPLWIPSTGTKAGWVRLNARTIGSAASGATERASSDCEQLFLYLWNNFPDTICPVLTGRLGTAAADWAAAKQITTINMRGKGAFGVTDMGNSDAGNISSGYVTTGSPIIGGSFGGDDDALIALTNLPAANLSAASLSASSSPNANPWVRAVTPSTSNVAAAAGISVVTSVNPTNDNLSITTTIGGSVPLGGSGVRLPIMPNFVLGTWFMRL